MIRLYVTQADTESEHDVGAALARFALYDAYALRAPLKKDARGKPYFDGAPIYVSISHSKGMCLAALSEREVGADIELTGTDTEHLTRLARRYFTSAEADYVSAAPAERFYEVWCAKESYIKYTGEGFSRALATFSVLESEMCFSHFEYSGYHIAVCSREPIIPEPPVFISADKL